MCKQLGLMTPRIAKEIALAHLKAWSWCAGGAVVGFIFALWCVYKVFPAVWEYGLIGGP